LKIYLHFFKQYYSFVQILKYTILLTAVLTIIDILNLPTKYLFIFDSKTTIFISIALTLFLFLLAIELHLIDAIKIISINIIDALSITLLLSLIIYAGNLTYFSILELYKIYTIIILAILIVLYLITRIINLHKYNKNSIEYKSNIIDLKKIQDGDFLIEKGKPILVDEKDVEYDLLRRGSTISLLYNTIQNSNPDKGFVISLEGKWGSGKTTIINNVKKKLTDNNENIIIIDELDPWSYSNQEALFCSMFDFIIQKSGLKISTFTTRQMIESVYFDIFGNRKTSLLKNLFVSTDTINSSKNRINDYLKVSGKKVIFFIDNIDRTESENIILLFKLIGNVFDFERVIYVLSFDNQRVKKILENNLNIDYQYLKKVIQMQLRVPEIDKSILNNLIVKCINNILISYGEKEKELIHYKSFCNFLSNQISDIRDFKRFINSVLTIPFNEVNRLNKRDLLSIEHIRLNNLNLYETIYKNRIYFISHDKMSDTETYSLSFNKQSFNTTGKAFFNQLFEDESNSGYIEILQDIFPYVKKHSENQILEYDGNIIASDSSYSEIAKNKRICSAKYFDLYFTQGSNDFLEIGKLIEGFVDQINNEETLNGIDTLFKELLNSAHYTYHKELMERLQLYLEDFKEYNLYYLTKALFNNLDNVSNSRSFMSLNALSRTEIILWELLQKITESEYANFLETIKFSYNRLQNIKSILYWFEKDKEGKNIADREEKLLEVYKNMGIAIINQSINLYHDAFYSYSNIWGLYSLYKEDEVTIKQYAKEIVNEENIFRFLYDLTSTFIGTNVRYSISEENINHFTTVDQIDEILKNTEVKNKDQEFILEVYNNFKNDIRDSWDEIGVVTGNILNINL
jgi:hypothetical protein